MKRTFALVLSLILLCLPMTKSQMIRCIRCQNPEYTYEELVSLPAAELRSMLSEGVSQ